jgi:hypothetical protein
MTALSIGPFYAACLLLLAAGTIKAWQPAATVRALRLAKLPGSSSMVRLGGMAEAVLAATAVIAGGPLAAVAVTASYLGFTWFVVRALRLGAPLSSCGCFGRSDTRPTLVHVAVNLACAGVAAVAALLPLPDAATVSAAQPLAGLPLLALSGATAYAVFALLSPAAQLQVERGNRAGATS